MKELEKLLQLGKDYNIESQEEKNEGNIITKTIYVSCKKKKDKCPVCNTYTSSVHDKLKAIELKYLKIAEVQ